MFLILLVITYFSPIAKIKIGGEHATPLLTKWRWFAITICTTIATGILFWGTAEPVYHLYESPQGLGLASNSEATAQFAMSTMFMHWTFTPYAIYTVAGLVFALAYYNYKQDFSLGAMLFPLRSRKVKPWLANLTDIVCLYSLVAGMSAALGAGILTISGGLNTVLGITQSPFLLGIIGLAIVATFIISAASGLKKGIRILSDFNIKAFITMAIIVFLASPTFEVLGIGLAGAIDYVQHFIPRSINLDKGIDKDWLNSWTVFYWANWMAWAPISALFLGRLSLGYTVRDFIHFNLIYPSLFGAFWMIVFSGATIHFETLGVTPSFYETLQNQGPQNVIFALLEQLPFGAQVLSLIFLLLAFLSYVTAADSNTSAMSGICTQGVSPETPEAPLLIKIIWGSIVGILAWVMVAYAGTDGIRIISVLGGFPAMFLLIAVGIGLCRIIVKKGEIKEVI